MTTVLHLHIPRTGGISVSRNLRSVHRDRTCVSFTTEEALRGIVQGRADVGLVTGHFPWGLHALVPDHVYFVVLRDPVARVGSLYDFIRSQPVHRHYARFSSATLAKLLSERKIEQSQLSNGQVRQLRGSFRSRPTIEAGDLDVAWTNLCGPNVVVAFTDDINGGLERLSERIGRRIEPCDKIRNRANREPPAADVVARIRALNRWDVELYERARARFLSAASA